MNRSNSYAQGLVASITLFVIGCVMVSVCLSLRSYESWYRYVDNTKHTVTLVFFYIGLFILFLGLIMFLRLLTTRRPNFRGVIFSRAQPAAPPQQTTIVLSTVMTPSSYQERPQLYPKQQYTTQQTIPQEFYPQAPPPYSAK